MLIRTKTQTHSHKTSGVATRALQQSKTETATPNKAADSVELSDAPWDPTQSFASLVEKDDSGRYVLDGVRWDYDEVKPGDWQAGFDRVEVNTSKIKDVSVGIVPFMKDKMAHSILVFEFEEGHGIKNSKGETQDKLVLSVDARMRVGEKWSVSRGLKREMPLVYQLDSFSARVKRGCEHLGDKLILHKLDLDQNEKKALITNSLDAAVTPKENYHSTRNSCWTNAIDLINKSVDSGQQIRKKSRLTGGLLHRFPIVNPVLAGSVLRYSNLLTDEPRLVIQADKTRHPDKQVSEKNNPILQTLSKSKAWTPAMIALGGAALGAAGYAVGGLIPAVFGGFLGASIGGVTGDEVKVRSQQVYAPAEQFYAN